MAEEQLDGWIVGLGGGGGALGLREMKNKLLAVIKRNGLRHPLLSMPPTLLSLSISSRVAISLFVRPYSQPLEFSFNLYLLL